MTVGRRIAIAALLACLAFPLHPRTRDADLDRVRAEIARLKKRLDDVRQQAHTTQQEVEAADLDLGIRTRELEIAIEAEKTLVAQKQQLEEQIAAIQPRIARQREYLSRRLAALYRLGTMSYLRLFFQIDRRRDPLEAVSMLTYLIRRDARAVTRFEEARRDLAFRTAQLADRHRRLSMARQHIEQRRQAVAAAYREKQRLLTRLRREESGSAQQLAELEEKAIRLERLVDFLSKQSTGVPAEQADVRTFEGALPWPVAGRVIEQFGRRRNPKFATFTVNNGIRIDAQPGTPVRTVFQGTVLFAQWFKGYGNLVIVDHGNRVFSLYGNLKSATVVAGERLGAGQTIAGVGEGEETGGYLYFEIRRDNRPEDPQKWLR
ncbi:MAG TPA: peptidoglycan DD-metalloendopeptidase family protein [Thermoanaerobaculia bacterium]|nr:peptidoglycan DD-metalloendopeptidase family protein [Thermoanaerobaculia bacterium]